MSSAHNQRAQLTQVESRPSRRARHEPKVTDLRTESSNLSRAQVDAGEPHGRGLRDLVEPGARGSPLAATLECANSPA